MIFRRRGDGEETPPEPLGVLLLPSALEEFELRDHARDLLAIPRVIALEPPRVRIPGFLRDSAGVRTATRLRFPGQPRLLVLYDPAQYPLARALGARYGDAELWYIRRTGEPGQGGDEDRVQSDALARERAAHTVEVTRGQEVAAAPLRARLRELGVIDPHAFLPGTRRRP